MRELNQRRGARFRRVTRQRTPLRRRPFLGQIVGHELRSLDVTDARSRRDVDTAPLSRYMFENCWCPVLRKCGLHFAARCFGLYLHAHEAKLGIIDFYAVKLRNVVQFAKDGTPAVFEHVSGKGRGVYIAATPGIGYIKAAKFVANDLAEKWPAAQRSALTRYAAEAGAAPLVKLSHPAVEAGIYDAPVGSALI